MRYPNTRYGNPVAFAYYIQGVPITAVAKRLRRSERSIIDWLAGKRKMPWWIPELLRLQHMEHCEVMRQMGMKPPPAPLHLVNEKAPDLFEIRRLVSPGVDPKTHASVYSTRNFKKEKSCSQ